MFQIALYTKKCVGCFGKPDFYGGHVVLIHPLSPRTSKGKSYKESLAEIRVISGLCHECDEKGRTSHDGTGFRGEWKPEMGIEKGTEFQI